MLSVKPLAFYIGSFFVFGYKIVRLKKCRFISDIPTFAEKVSTTEVVVVYYTV